MVVVFFPEKSALGHVGACEMARKAFKQGKFRVVCGAVDAGRFAWVSRFANTTYATVCLVTTDLPRGRSNFDPRPVHPLVPRPRVHCLGVASAMAARYIRFCCKRA